MLTTTCSFIRVCLLLSFDCFVFTYRYTQDVKKMIFLDNSIICENKYDRSESLLLQFLLKKKFMMTHKLEELVYCYLVFFRLL